MLNQFFGFTHPLADQVGGTNAKEGTLALSCARFRQVRFSRTRRSVEQNASPWFDRFIKQLGKLDRKNDGLLQRLLCSFEPGHVGPFYVGLLSHNCACKSPLHFFLLLIFFVVLVLSFLFLRSAALCFLLRGLVENGLLNVLCTVKVLRHSIFVDLDKLRVFLD